MKRQEVKSISNVQHEDLAKRANEFLLGTDGWRLAGPVTYDSAAGVHNAMLVRETGENDLTLNDYQRFVAKNSNRDHEVFVHQVKHHGTDDVEDRIRFTRD